jgi:hypothetical protein
MNLKALTPFCAVLLLAMFSAGAAAQPLIAPFGSVASDDPDGTFTPWGDAYGASMDSWKKYFVVGTPLETAFRDGADFMDGAVYIYKRGAGGSLIFKQKITLPGTSVTFGDRLGGGVSLRNGWLLVAAANAQDFGDLVDPREGLDNNFPQPFLFAGQVYAFRLNRDSGAFEYMQTLISPEPGSFGAFGARSQSTHIALNDEATVAVIGEQNNFEPGVGQFHVFTRDDDDDDDDDDEGGNGWTLSQSLDPPFAGIDFFGDAVAFINDELLLVGGVDFADDFNSAEGYAFVYEVDDDDGEIELQPIQTIVRAAPPFNDCILSGHSIFGEAGLAVSERWVAIADPCADGTAGTAAGRVELFRVTDNDSRPLRSRQIIEGEFPFTALGGNLFGSRESVALNHGGKRLLIGAPLYPAGPFDPGAFGADVRVFEKMVGAGWVEIANLATNTPETTGFRNFGETVNFTGNFPVVSESNFLDPIVTGFKSQVLIYDLGD